MPGSVSQLLLEHWSELRQTSRLDEVLPGAQDQPGDDGQYPNGRYETRDYRLHRGVPIPGTGRKGGDLVADLIELYTSVSVRTDGWACHNLHFHVVAVKDEPLRLSHLDHLLRCFLGLQKGLWANGLEDLRGKDQGPLSVYLCGALIGPSVKDDLGFVSALTELERATLGSPIRIGVATLHPLEGLTVTRPPALPFTLEDYANRHDARGAATARALLESLPGFATWQQTWEAQQEQAKEAQQQTWEAQQEQAMEAQQAYRAARTEDLVLHEPCSSKR